MKRFGLLLSIALLTAVAINVVNGQSRTAVFPSGTIIDLSYSFDSSAVYWPTAETFQLEKDFEGTTEQGYYYSAYRYSAAEHGGTHIDAPVHFAKGRNSADQIPLEQLMGAGIVVDVRKQCEKACTLNGNTQLALITRLSAGNAGGNDSAIFVDKILQ